MLHREALLVGHVYHMRVRHGIRGLLAVVLAAACRAPLLSWRACRAPRPCVPPRQPSGACSGMFASQRQVPDVC
jgi:hypothetical protein